MSKLDKASALEVQIMTAEEALEKYATDKDLSWANLRKADLSEADLSRANLRGADLREANLSRANLRWANLRGADLREANLRVANLREADLSRAILSEAILSEADLSWADLGWANLSEANLRVANLRKADLSWANLSNANLRGADLREAILRGANLDNCFGLTGRSIVPEVGCFHGFKKLRNGKICELIIGKNSRRVGGLVGRKCRAEYVKVVSGSGVSTYDASFTYEPGKIVRAKNFDPDPRIECSGGIHFFLTREEAEGFAYWIEAD